MESGSCKCSVTLQKPCQTITTIIRLHGNIINTCMKVLPYSLYHCLSKYILLTICYTIPTKSTKVLPNTHRATSSNTFLGAYKCYLLCLTKHNYKALSNTYKSIGYPVVVNSLSIKFIAPVFITFLLPPRCVCTWKELCSGSRMMPSHRSV